MIIMKKIISLVLALTLVFGLAAMSAGAEGEKISPNNSYYAAVKYACENDFLDAKVEDVTVDELNAGLLRGDFIVMLAKMAGVDLSQNVTATVKNSAGQIFGVDKCTDIEAGTELYNAAAWAFKNDLITGYTTGLYHPELTLTREEAVAIVWRYIEHVGVAELGLAETNNLYYYYDAADYVGRYSEEAIQECLKYGIFKGDAVGKFGAGERDITLAQMCAVVYRTLENETAQMNTTKFYLAVESGEGYVSAHVNDNYIMKIEVSAKNLAPATVKLIAEMNNVASLGVNSSKSHSVTINTGLSEDLDPSLKNWMVNTFAFDGASINVDINGKTCVYNVGAVEYETETEIALWFVPADVAATRAAWQELTSHVTTSTQTTDDSYILIGAGSELQLGSEKIVLEGAAAVNGLELDGFNDIDGLKQTIRDGVKLETGYEEAIAGVLGAGTELAVGQSVATLGDEATITIEGVPTAEVEGILSDLRDATSTYAMAELLIKAIDGVIGAIDDGTGVSVAIDFAE